MSLIGVGFGEIAEEFSELQCDSRLQSRCVKLLSKWIKQPGVGFPQVLESDSDLEATYRFFNNPRLNFDMLLHPHINETVKRGVQAESDVICIHDSSTFIFSSTRKDLGSINKNNRGFLGHFSLLSTYSRDETKNPVIPLGVIAASVWKRSVSEHNSESIENKSDSIEGDESSKWMKHIQSVEKQLGTNVRAIHVMDRESDIYASLSTMMRDGIRFVIRSCWNRSITDGCGKLWETLEGLPVLYQENISIGSQHACPMPNQAKAHPSRRKRLASLHVSASLLTI